MRPALRFGLFLGQGGRDLADVVGRFKLAEELGFDHGWLVDHLVDTDGGPGTPVHEAWTLLAAIAAETSRIRIGTLVTSNTFRHPVVLLKQAVTVDHISGGRLILGIGSGWNEDEHRRYGIDLPAPGDRVSRLEEAVEIIDRLQREERTSFEGRFYRLVDAPLDPKPIQRPRIPLLIAAHRPRMLRLAAQFADQWDTFRTGVGESTEGVAMTVGEQAEVVATACHEAGRDPDSIRRSTWADREALASVEAFESFVETHRRLGFTDLSVWLPDLDRPTRDVLERVARNSIPRFRAEDAATRD